MKFAAIKPNELAIVNNETLIPVNDVLPKGSTMIDLIVAYDGVKEKLSAIAASGGGTGLDPKTLKPPVQTPSKIWAAAGNYKRGTAGLGEAAVKIAGPMRAERHVHAHAIAFGDDRALLFRAYAV